jgi:ATP-dependent protease ClpP protease subunit
MRYNLKVDPRLKAPEEFSTKCWDIPMYLTVDGEINEESAKKFRDGLASAEDTAFRSKQKIIPITIDTLGGCAYSLMGMIDAIKNCTVPIATIVEAKAFSAGVILFSCGTEGHRYMGPSATLMIHSTGVAHISGKVNDVKASVEELSRINEKVYKIMSRNCGQEENYFGDIIQNNNVDWFLDSEEALTHNLANEIKVPSFEVKVEISHKFG